MANKPESALDAITSLGSTFVRMISSGGESVKATIANVAKYIIETYASSSLAGSNQSVKSAIDSLNSNKGRWSTILNSTSDTGTFELSDSYRNYASLSIMLFNGTSLSSVMVPTNMLITSGYTVRVHDGEKAVELTFPSQSSAKVEYISSNASVRVYGIK